MSHIFFFFLDSECSKDFAKLQECDFFLSASGSISQPYFATTFVPIKIKTVQIGLSQWWDPCENKHFSFAERTPAPSDWTHLQTSGGCCVCPPDGFPNLMRKQKKKTSWPIGNKRPCTKLSKNMALGSETEKSGPNFFPFSFFLGIPNGSTRDIPMDRPAPGRCAAWSWGWSHGTTGDDAPAPGDPWRRASEARQMVTWRRSCKQQPLLYCHIIYDGIINCTSTMFFFTYRSII